MVGLKARSIRRRFSATFSSCGPRCSIPHRRSWTPRHRCSAAAVADACRQCANRTAHGGDRLLYFEECRSWLAPARIINRAPAAAEVVPSLSAFLAEANAEPDLPAPWRQHRSRGYYPERPGRPPSGPAACSASCCRGWCRRHYRASAGRPRGHISDDDIARLKSELTRPLNLEMAATDEMLAIALRHLRTPAASSRNGARSARPRAVSTSPAAGRGCSAWST